MKGIFISLALVLLINASEYQDKTAQEKKEDIMQQCNADARDQDWFSDVRMAELFIESMDTSFDTFEDKMPKQSLGLETRPKLIHTVGLVAEGQFISNGQHSYTGVFKGADHVVIRISSAKKAQSDPPAVAPGVGIKFLRDGMYSGNVVAMYQLAGQSSFNFFEHDWTNHVPGYQGSDMSLKLLAKKFRTASDYPYFVGLSDMARFDQNGVEEQAPKFPFRLVLHPSVEAHTAFSSEPVEGNKYYADEIDEWKVDTLWNVYAQPEPTSEDVIEIGKIVMTSPFDASKYSDETLFIQHIRFEDDLKYRPDWEQISKDIIKQQESASEQFKYDDLPWNQ